MRPLADDEKFVIRPEERVYRSVQYSSFYFSRLMRLLPIIKARACSLWPDLPVRGVAQVEKEEECVVIGTLYKDMKLKPSVLDDYARLRASVPMVVADNFVAEDDQLILEDSRGRMILKGSSFSPALWLTGVVVAVRGKEQKNGDFQVSQILPAGFPPSSPSLPTGLSPLPSSKFVAIISGLNFGLPASNPLPRTLLLNLLSGFVSSSTEEEEVSARLERVVLAGESCCSQDQLADLAHPHHATNNKDSKVVVSHIKEFDMFLSQVASAVDVDVMPGPSDPSNSSLPQQPLHRCLLPSSSLYSSLLLATNPHEFQVNGIRFLGTSGQNIDNMQRYSNAFSEEEGEGEGEEHKREEGMKEGRGEKTPAAIRLLEKCLEWRHLAPTAPDTLGCYPFQSDDPFVIETCPQVFFCGNQPSFAKSVLKGDLGQQVLAISVPSFVQTGELVLVDTSSMDCHCVKITQQVLT